MGDCVTARDKEKINWKFSVQELHSFEVINFVQGVWKTVNNFSD